MNKLIMQAQAKAAQKFAEMAEAKKFDTEKLNKILTTALMSTALVIGATSHQEAQAMDKSTYKALGTAAGALLGAKAGNKMSYAERSTLTVVGGIVGMAVGDSMGAKSEAESRAEERAREKQRKREEAAYRDWERQSVMRTASRPQEVIYVQDNRRNVSQVHNSRDEGYAQTRYDPAALGMPDILSQAIKRTGSGGLSAEGSVSLEHYQLGLKSLKAASDALIRGGRMYAAAAKTFDEAQLTIGSEGSDIRAKAANKLVAVESVLINKTNDWVRVRNTLAEQGYDVTPFDSKVSEEFSNIRPTARNSHSTNNRYRP